MPARRRIPLTARGWRWLGYAAMAAIGIALFAALKSGALT